MPFWFTDFPVPVFMPDEDAIWLPYGDNTQATLCTIKDLIKNKDDILEKYEIIPKSGPKAGIKFLVNLDEITIIPKKPS